MKNTTFEREARKARKEFLEILFAAFAGFAFHGVCSHPLQPCHKSTAKAVPYVRDYYYRPAVPGAFGVDGSENAVSVAPDGMTTY